MFFMGFKDELYKNAEALNRAESMSHQELYNKLKNNDFDNDYDRRAAIQSGRYRTGLDKRPGEGGTLCFITTAVCDSFGKADDCYELTAFRNFRDKWLALQSDGKNLIAEYYEVAPKIVEKINSLTNSAEIYKNIWSDYLQNCLKSIEVGDNVNCKKIYVEMVNALKEKFLK